MYNLKPPKKEYQNIPPDITISNSTEIGRIQIQYFHILFNTVINDQWMWLWRTPNINLKKIFWGESVARYEPLSLDEFILAFSIAKSNKNIFNLIFYVKYNLHLYEQYPSPWYRTDKSPNTNKTP